MGQVPAEGETLPKGCLLKVSDLEEPFKSFNFLYSNLLYNLLPTADKTQLPSFQ